MLYSFNKESLLFEKSNKVVKYRVITSVLVCLLLFLSSFSAEKILKEKELTETINKKQQLINQIKEPLREDNYVEDLYKAIGFNLNEKQYKTFSQLSLKYRKQIEEAHVPASLVWWICYKESRFQINAKSSTSSAYGLFQFVSGTYKAMSKLAGTKYEDRTEKTQVKIMLTYLNYLYNKTHSWEKTVDLYCGGKAHYKTNFLFK